MAEAGGKPRLAGKVALVTGAGSSGPGVGTGKAIAITLAREGAKLMLMDRDPGRAGETLAAIADELGSRDIGAVCAGDVSHLADCRAVVDAAVARFGKLDILVNNVGISRNTDVLGLKEEDWDAILDVNLKGMALMASAAIPHLLKSGHGAMVHISSVAAHRPSGTTVAYAAAKGGVEAMSRSIAVTHGEAGIRSNCVAPGNIYTPMVAARMDERKRRDRRIGNPMRTEGTAWDIAQAVAFLASDEARWITGQTLIVDGGYTAAPIGWFTAQQRKASDAQS